MDNNEKEKRIIERWQHLQDLHLTKTSESNPDVTGADAEYLIMNLSGLHEPQNGSTENAAFISHRSSGNMTPKEIVAKAIEIVNGARRDSYGDPRDNHFRTALLIDAYIIGIDRAITPEDVCIINLLQKISRGIHNGYDDDTLVDMVGYILNLAEVRNLGDQP